MRRDPALAIAGVTKHQYYHRPSGNARGRKASEVTLRVVGDDVERVPNGEVWRSSRAYRKIPIQLTATAR